MLTIPRLLDLVRRRGLDVVWSAELGRPVLRGDRAAATEELLEVLRLRRDELTEAVAPREYLGAFGVVVPAAEVEAVKPLAWRIIGEDDSKWRPCGRGLEAEIEEAIAQRKSVAA